MDLGLTFGINDTFPVPPEVPGDTRSNAANSVLLTSQLAVASFIGLLSFLLFCFLRPRWRTLFAPRTRLKGYAPPDLPPSFLGWVIALIKVPESEVLDRVGLDAAVLLGFFKMAYKLFSFCTVFALIFFTPIRIYNRMHPRDDNGDDPVEVPADQIFTTAISYVLFTWVFSLATFYFMYYNYRAFIEVRRHYYLKLKDTLVVRTVMVTVIPKKLQNNRALAEYYESLGIGKVTSAIVCRHVRQLRHAIELRTHYLNQLEKAYAEWLGNPCTDPEYDPDTALREIESPSESSSGFDELGPLLETSPTLSKIQRKRPTFRDGFLHIFGKKVDKIDYYTKRLNTYDKLVEKGRNGNWTLTSVGFVTFEKMASAQIAAQTLNHPEPLHCRTTLAPEPRDVYWRNITLRERELVARGLIVRIVIIALVFFWSGPISVFASLLNLNTLAKVFPWLAKLAGRNEMFKGLIQGSLPTLAVSLFNALLPVILHYLCKVQGLQARSWIELSIISKFFFFLLVNVLLIFTIAGTVYKSIEKIITEPAKLAKILATTLPNVAPFFVNFVILEGIGLYPLRLLQFFDVCSTLIRRLFLAKTPRQYADASAPPFLNYGVAYPRAVLIFVIILVYSAISPNILFFGSIYFFLGYFTFKYLLLYVYFHPYESAGQAWPLIFHRSMFGICIFQTMMIGLLALRENYFLACSVAPLLVVTGIFINYISLAFDSGSGFIPLKQIQDAENKLPVSRAEVTTESASQQATLGPSEEQVALEETVPERDNAAVKLSQKGGPHREILDDDLYHAEPDLYTDYIQPPMTLYPGVLNTGMRRYGPPALVGILPWLWLPVKRSQADKESAPGFFRGLLGMHKKGNDAKPCTTTAEDSIDPTRSDSVRGEPSRRYSRIIDEQPDQDPNNPHRTYYHHPTVESPAREAETSAQPPPEPPRKPNRVSTILEDWAGNNFGEDNENDDGQNSSSGQV